MRAAAKASPAGNTSVPKSAIEPGEPIAIVGMACRFGGAPNLDAYWRMIRDGLEGATEVPADRWDVDDFYSPSGGPGKTMTRRGAFLEGVDQFEPTFFGVTPREAARMDPQQRLLLEVAWETFENAGRPADQMVGTATGVYVGVGATDYMKAPIHAPDYFELIDAHVGTGNALSIAANRVSYALDLRGPSMAVDTACSSSSLAIHLAIESLRRGECTAALAGGANAILTPEVTIAFSNAQMLSPEGRCRSYDAGASGYVRGEGCAFVLLKTLKQAELDGDDVLAVLRGSAVNQDGRTPGISAPSVTQQQACLHAAMADAGVTPTEIDYVEGHGTGTPLGDPIELQALAHVFPKRAETDAPLWVTSVKANIGHTETVSGAAGLIKTVLLLQNEIVPPQLHLEKLNPHAVLDGSRVLPLTEAQPWPSRLADGGSPRIAGVSSFGFGGTNTHLIVAEAPIKKDAVAAGEASVPAAERSHHVVKLAAKTPDRVPEQAARLAEWMRSDAGRDATPADIAYTANTGRGDLAHRVAAVVDTRQSLLAVLDKIADGSAAEEALPSRKSPRTAWLFTGQGSQRVGMGRELYQSEPVFRDVIDRCDATLGQVLPDRLVDVLYGSTNDDTRINETRYTQPALFAVECGLAALWASWGVEPDVLLGHSIGEYAAAVTAEVLTLEDAARLVGERARLMHEAPGEGSMAVVFAAESEVATALAGREGCLAIAATNGPQNTVLSGGVDEVDAALMQLKEQGIDAKRLVVSHAFHSPLMDPVLDEFERFAATIKHRPPQTPIASNVTGKLITADNPPKDWARYWREHLRGTVRFAQGVSRAARTGATHWIEIGPAPILAGMAARCDAEFTSRPKWIASLRPQAAAGKTIAHALATYWAEGGAVDWRRVDRGRLRRRLPLPNYPWHRERFWYENLQRGAANIAKAPADASPVLGSRLPVASDGQIFEAPIDAKTPAWLVDHQVRGSIVAPGAMFVEQALAAAGELADANDAPLGVEGVIIRQALVPPETDRLRLQTVIEREAGGRRRLTIHSAHADAEPPAWTEHAEALVASRVVAPKLPDREGFDGRVIDRQPRGEFYQTIAARGLEYGQAFRVLDDIRRSAYDAIADFVPSKAVAAELDRYRLHPAIGDGLLQTVAATLPLEADGSYSPHTYLPVRIDSVCLHRPLEKGEPLTAYALRRSPAPETDESSPENVEADAYLIDGGGRPVATLRGVRLQRLASASTEANAATEPTDWLYQIEWQPSGTATAEAWSAGPTLIFDDGTQEIAEAIASRGGACLVVRRGERFTTNVEEVAAGARTVVTLDPNDVTHYERLIEMFVANPGGKPAAVVFAWSSDEAARWGATDTALRLLQQLVRRSVTPDRGVWFVTQNAQTTGVANEAPATPQQAALVGLGRVAAMEHHELGVRLIDFDFLDAEQLVTEIASVSGENQIAYRQGQRHVARLVKAEALAEQVGGAIQGTPTPDSPSWRLGLKRSGSFDGLAYQPSDRVAPGAGQVEIEVHATGLNFSDVLKALGLYPGLRDAVVPLGIEASGVVTAVGAGVEHLRVGDEAIGVLPHAFGSHATTAAYAMVKKPAGISHEEASTIPIVFLTAHHALVRLAQIERGERVLIHAAAGGVGLAALQIAQHAGAEVFATAGSDEKRDLLRSLGVEHVMDSRSLDFVQQVRDATDGQGVDVVLNSLPGEAIDASLGLLRAYGRFCEIGKIDIYQDHKIGLLPFQDNLSYFAIDLDRLLRERPEQVRRLFVEVMQRFSEGVYRPLPFTRFATEKTADAFRYMSLRKNIGKVVVSMQPEEWEASDSGPVIRGGGYLVTGGFGALGRKVASWLVDRGAGGLALMSRREPNDDANLFLTELREAGAKAISLRGDVGDGASLTAALASLPDDFPSVVGVIHAAGVLDDGLLTDLDPQRFAKVLQPKADGAWNLHLATQDATSPLAGVEQFVLFSSVAATLGSPGQANYAAANASLDALAQHRRSLGLPATSLAWGPWAGGGMAAGETADAVRSKGMDLLPADEALGLMGRLMATETASVAVFDARWEAMSKLLAGRRPALLEGLLIEGETAGGRRGDAALRQRLLSASDEERQAELVSMVRAELARVTSVAPEEIEPAAPLTAIGIDSLMALELKNNLESKLAITLPMGKLLAGPTVITLAEAAAEELVGEAPAETNAEWQPLVTLREGTAVTPPLFLMPVLGGDAGAYRHLADSIPDDQAVIAIRPRGLDTDEAPHRNLQEAAADYAAAIRRHRGDGPYKLAGWSTGGITALAVAVELEAAGETVAGVELFDAPSPNVYADVDTEDDAAFLAAILDFAARFAGKEANLKSMQAIDGASEQERFATTLAIAKEAGLVPAEVDESYIRRLIAVGEALVVATRGYEPHPIDAPVRFFAPMQGGALESVGARSSRGVEAWRDLFGELLSEHAVPGDHFSMMSGAGAEAIAAVLVQDVSVSEAAAT